MINGDGAGERVVREAGDAEEVAEEEEDVAEEVAVSGEGEPRGAEEEASPPEAAAGAAAASEAEEGSRMCFGKILLYLVCVFEEILELRDESDLNQKS